jgi:hypothetical protein
MGNTCGEVKHRLRKYFPSAGCGKYPVSGTVSSAVFRSSHSGPRSRTSFWLRAFHRRFRCIRHDP